MNRNAPPGNKTLLIAGATGLVGGHALRMALGDARVAQVIAPTRRALPAHPRLSNPVVDFDRLPVDADWWAVDAVVCALGTTMAKAGSQAAFRKVDLELPLRVARLCRERGARAFALNSALGADPASRVFYSRVKGELEVALREVGFESLTLVRPGLIGGERQESRPTERISIWLGTTLAPLLPRRYRIVPAPAIARCLLDAALAARPGVAVVASEAIGPGDR